MSGTFFSFKSVESTAVSAFYFPLRNKYFKYIKYTSEAKLSQFDLDVSNMSVQFYPCTGNTQQLLEAAAT